MIIVHLSNEKQENPENQYGINTFIIKSVSRKFFTFTCKTKIIQTKLQAFEDSLFCFRNIIIGLAPCNFLYKPDSRLMYHLQQSFKRT